MDIRALFYGLSFAMVWSSAFTTARVLTLEVAPLMALCLRFAISGLIAICIAYAWGQRLRFSRSQWRALLIFGVFQNACYLGFMWGAAPHIEASLSVIICSTMPLLVAFFEWGILRKKLPFLAIAGLVTGMGGVALIMGGRLSGDASWWGITLALLGVLSLTVATLVAHKASSGENMVMGIGVQMLIASVVLVIPAYLFEEVPTHIKGETMVAFAYAILGPGLLATFIWMALIQRIGTIRASVYHFLTPFFGMAIAALYLGERITVQDLVGVTIITLGILAVQVSKQKPASKQHNMPLL